MRRGVARQRGGDGVGAVLGGPGEFRRECEAAGGDVHRGGPPTNVFRAGNGNGNSASGVTSGAVYGNGGSEIFLC